MWFGFYDTQLKIALLYFGFSFQCANFGTVGRKILLKMCQFILFKISF